MDAQTNNNENTAKPQNDSVLKKIFKNITVEPLVACWLFPFLLTYVSIENLNLEKACRGFIDDGDPYGKDICKIFIRKYEFEIDCQEIESENAAINTTLIEQAISTTFPDIFEKISGNLSDALTHVCNLEEKVQIKMAQINSIRNPLSAVGPLIIILFAGPWSDKKGLRVPCMIVPFLGEALGFLSVFISAIFIDGPVEIPAYAYRLIPSFTGAENLMVIAIFSYLSVMSSDENRTFRFGMFQIFMTIVPIIGQLLSPFISETFDYTVLFGMMIPIHVIGLAYAIFILKEPKPEQKSDACYDNPVISTELPNTPVSSGIDLIESTDTIETKNACLEFFDPQLAVQCIRSFIKKRPFGVRPIIIIIMLMHFLTHGVIQGETPLNLYYQREKLNWSTNLHVYHNVFTIVTGLIGTIVMVGVLSKYLKVPDIVLTIISTALSVASKIFYSAAKTTLAFFTGTAIDFTAGAKFLGVKSLISKLVSTDDLSTMYAVMGLFEALAGLVFPHYYPKFYEYLLNEKKDVSHMFQVSAVILAFAFICYIILFKMIKTKEKSESTHNGNNLPTKVESTKM